MASIYLMRHGQASFASDDYDQLSETGIAQARLNGQVLAQQGRLPTHIVHGSLKRQQQSVAAFLDGLKDAGVKQLPPTQQVEVWNEFDHNEVIAVHGQDAGDLRQLVAQSDDKEKTFAGYFVAAMRRWVEGRHDQQYRETFTRFSERVEQGLTELSLGIEGDQRVLVVTSGGPISMVAKRLLKMDIETALELNWRLVNGGLTKVAVASASNTQGSSPRLQLISLNEHLHFSGPHAHLLTAR